jgi:hypothetical protein
MITVKIYKPAKTATQSGRGNTQNWVLQYENENSQYIEPVMQWTASTSTKSQVKIPFVSKEEAIMFAEKNGWKYILQEPHKKIIKPKSYTDNFIRPGSN